MKHLESTKARALSLRQEGLSYAKIREAMYNYGVGVSKETLRLWFKGLTPPDTQPSTEAHTLEEKLCAVRVILNGDPAPPWLTERDFLDLGKNLAQAENQHRLSQVNLTATGLTRENSIDFVRRVSLEAAKRYRVQGNPELEAIHIGFIEWVRTVIAEYNPVLARDL